MVPKIDLKGETIMIVRATSGYVFGGYTNMNWTAPAKLLT